MERIELLILRNLIYNEEYTRKVIPFIKDDYFEEQNQKIIFQDCLLYTSPSPRDATLSRMPSSA